MNEEPRYCQGCGREMYHGRPDKTWCTEACRQLTLKDRRWLRLRAAMKDPKMTKRKLVVELELLFGESLRAAEARAQDRSSRSEAATG